MKPELMVPEVCARIAGTDIHPVAVIIARVTYLLALAPALNERRGSVSIPVYLGDAMQLSISEIVGGKELTIRVPPPPAGQGASGTTDANGREQLDFPDTFCREPALFDQAIERMRTGSEAGMTRAQIETALVRITERFYKADITVEQKLAIADLGKTYVTMDKLRREGRDSVWSYVARNLSRPLAFSSGDGWASIMIGNPPWVAYRHMSPDLQRRFKELAKGENVYVGGKLTTQNDLCALFTVRASFLYLRSGGRLAFVLPLAALTRGQFERLRSGSFHGARIAWDEVWTMDDRLQPLFPVPACVVFGRRRATSRGLPDIVRAYTGNLPLRDASEKIADKCLKIENGSAALAIANFAGGSTYRKAFRQGATLVPRMLCFVERKSIGRLGSDRSAPYVVSRRSTLEKEPWKSLPGIENRVEAEFLKPVLLGESILPYRILQEFEAVIPATDRGEVLNSDAAANRGYDSLQGWMRKAEKIWNSESEQNGRSLIQRWNYHNELGAQFPLGSERVVYAASGTNPAACRAKSGQIFEHKLYWFAPTTVNEALYLCSLLNSEVVRHRASSFQSRGQWGARDFDKVAFNLPIPRFDSTNTLHAEIANEGSNAEKVASVVKFAEGGSFRVARKLVRDAIAESGIAPRIEALVTHLLDI